MFKQRILIQLSVRGDIRFISHHDLMRVLGRASRRAGLPVAMSEGFNPRQKISLMLARAVGVASECEYGEINLNGWVNTGELTRRLNGTLPDGLRVERAVLGDPRKRHQVAKIGYRVDCRKPVGISREVVERLLDKEEVWIDRTRTKAGRPVTKRVNIRPFIDTLNVSEHSIEMSLVVLTQGTTRPSEVWKALGLDGDVLLAEATITRIAMELSPLL